MVKMCNRKIETYDIIDLILADGVSIGVEVPSCFDMRLAHNPLLNDYVYLRWLLQEKTANFSSCTSSSSAGLVLVRPRGLSFFVPQTLKR